MIPLTSEIRWVYNVVDQMVPHVPKRETGLLADLKRARDTSLYQPPEAQTTAWRKLQWALVGRWKRDPRSVWGKRLFEIYDVEFQKSFPEHHAALTAAREAAQKSPKKAGGQ